MAPFGPVSIRSEPSSSRVAWRRRCSRNEVPRRGGLKLADDLFRRDQAVVVHHVVSGRRLRSAREWDDVRDISICERAQRIDVARSVQITGRSLRVGG